MSDTQMTPETQGAPAGAILENSILDQAVAATKQTEPDQAKDLLKTLTREALKGTVTWNKNITVTISEAIDQIDAAISKQLSQIMHNPEMQKLEGSWRGLKHLVQNSETGADLKIRMLHAKKREVAKDLSKAVEFDQSHLFKKPLSMLR